VTRFPTSLDCPPAAINLIATLPIAYALDTGTTTKTGVLMNNIGTPTTRIVCSAGSAPTTAPALS